MASSAKGVAADRRLRNGGEGYGEGSWQDDIRDREEMARLAGASIGAGKVGAARRSVQLAWLWLRYQPDSSQAAVWFGERVGSLQGRTWRIAIVALARAEALDRNLALCDTRP